MQYVIESNIPVPGVQLQSGLCATLKKLGDDQSFHIPDLGETTIRKYIRLVAQETGGKYITKKDGDGFRVWKLPTRKPSSKHPLRNCLSDAFSKVIALSPGKHCDIEINRTSTAYLINKVKSEVGGHYRTKKIGFVHPLSIVRVWRVE